jgi:hypothetical protein
MHDPSYPRIGSRRAKRQACLAVIVDYTLCECLFSSGVGLACALLTELNCVDVLIAQNLPGVNLVFNKFVPLFRSVRHDELLS